MTDVVLVPITAGHNLSAINNNFTKVQNSINNDVLNLAGGNNTMSQDIDLNGHSLLNPSTDTSNPNSIVTLGQADSRYYNVVGDSLTGPMNVNGQQVTNLPMASVPSAPVRKQEFDVYVVGQGARDDAQDVGTAANKSSSIRVPDGEAIPAVAAAGLRANKLLSFDSVGNPVAIAAANQSATDLELRLADSVDPIKGAGLVGRSIRRVSSFAELQTVQGRDAGDQVQLIGYFASSPGIGGGLFTWFPADTTTPDGGTVVQVGATVGRWKRTGFGNTVSPTWFGALGNGVNDSTAVAAAFATSHHVTFPAGDFAFTPQSVKAGCNIKGVGGRQSADPLLTTKLRNLTPNTTLLDQAIVSSALTPGFCLYDCFVNSDSGVRQNDPTVTIADGGASPPIMGTKIERCDFVPLTVGLGTGVSLSKCFDFGISFCNMKQFGTLLLMQGCDLGLVEHNRLTNIQNYGILELGVSTFGSQVEIRHNDMLLSIAGGTFIKTTGRHVRIHDNYLEQTSGSCAGFIDATSTGVPTFGANAVSTTRYASAVIEENRIDGHSLATSFIIRYEPVGAYAKIQDVGTTGPLSTLSWLTIVNDELPLFFNTTNGCIYDFHGGTQINSKWNSFKTSALRQTTGGVEFDAQSLLSLNNSELRRDNNHLKVALTPSGFVLKPTLTTVFNCILPIIDGLNNKFLASGVTYNVSVVARAKSGTPTLRIARLVSLAVQGSVIDTALTTQDKTIKFTMVGGLTTDTVGLGFRGVSASTDIEISSVTFSEA